MRWLGIAFVWGTFVVVDASRRDGACSVTPTIANGIVSQRSMRAGGIRYQFACYSDHHIHGDKYSTCKNGFWSNPFPLCTSNDCERPFIPEGVKTVFLKKNSVVLFFCNDESANGQKRYCHNGNWSGPPPDCGNVTLPQTHCSFNHQSTCGWLRGYCTFFLTWTWNPGGYLQTSTNPVGSFGAWALIDSLPETITTTLSPTPIKMSSPISTPSFSSTTPLSTSTTAITSSTASEARSPTSTTESYVSSTNSSTSPTNISTSSRVPTQSSTSSTNQSSPRISKRSAPLPTSHMGAELVSPEYPANYSAACFRMSYLRSGSIPSVLLRVSDSADVFLKGQNMTFSNQHGSWLEAAFEVPSVIRPFRLVLYATRVGVGVRDVKLEDIQCNGDAKEEPSTTEPSLDTEETTDPGSTEDWTTTTEPFDTTELPATTAKQSTDSPVPPTSSAASSAGSTPLARRRLRPIFRPRLSHRDWRMRRRNHYRQGFGTITRRLPASNPTQTSPSVSSNTLSNVSTSTTLPSPTVFSTVTTKPNNSSTSTTTWLFSSPSPPGKFSRLMTRVLSPTHMILPFSTRKASSFTRAPSSISSASTITYTSPKPPTSTLTSTSLITSGNSIVLSPKLATSSTPKLATPSTPKVAASSTLKVATSPVASTPSTPKIAAPSTLKVATSQVASTPSTPKIATPSTPKVALIVPSPKLASPTTKEASTTAKITSTTTTPSKSTSNIKIYSSSSATKIVSTTKSTPSSADPLSSMTSSSKTSTMPSTSFPIWRSTSVNRSELAWRIVPSSTPLTVPIRRYSTLGILRFRSTSTPKPTSTMPTVKSNQSMEVWPGPRFKVRTKYNITEATRTKESSLEGSGVSTSTTQVSGKTHWEIAMLLIGMAGLVGGLVCCLRKRFSWLQSSRVKLRDAYSLQINYADDVILDTLPSMANERNGTANVKFVEESSADGEKKRLRRKMCTTTSLGGFSRLKGSKNYSELE